MTRSTFKIPNSLTNNTTTPRLKTFQRCSIITPELINKIILLHNGKTFVPIKVTKHHIGFVLGQFISTKKTVRYKKKSNVNKKTRQ